MTNIELYLRGAMPYDKLTDAERCAICVAREGWLVQWIDEADWHPYCSAYMQYGWQMGEPDSDGECVADFMWKPVTQYLYDDTAALQFVERFGIEVGPIRNLIEDQLVVIGWYAEAANGYTENGTPSAAIVACVCEIAKAEWLYKEAK